MQIKIYQMLEIFYPEYFDFTFFCYTLYPTDTF